MVPFGSRLVAPICLVPSPIGLQPSFNAMSWVNLTVKPSKLLPALTASLKPSNLSKELISYSELAGLPSIVSPEVFSAM